MSTPTREDDKTSLPGTVSDADREYFAQLGEANAAARRATESPAGSLAVAFERMGRIERNTGIDVVATVRGGTLAGSRIAHVVSRCGEGQDRRCRNQLRDGWAA